MLVLICCAVLCGGGGVLPTPPLSQEHWWFLQVRLALAHCVSHNSKESTEFGSLASQGVAPSPFPPIAQLCSLNRKVLPPRLPCVSSSAGVLSSLPPNVGKDTSPGEMRS